jgi:cytochrome c-type biogenesis protein CcmE
MKKSYIILLSIIAIAIAVVISMTGDASEYVDFAQAQQLEKDGEDDLVHVVGTLLKDAQGNVEGLIYDPSIDPNHFEFPLKDLKGLTVTVLYLQPKPQDFEKSEQVVVVGKMKGNVFVADKILMKCPSKYEDKEVKGE